MKWIVALSMLMLVAACDSTVPAGKDTIPAGQQQPLEQATPQCPACGDGDLCTSDVCSPDTNYSCTYAPIAPCCGNSVCEEPEDNSTCQADCPSCAAGKCERASFDYEAKKCTTTPITPCCGNSVCEDGETGCADCPVCSTDEECLTASFDSAEQRCVTKPIVPCCGNGICDRGESCASCDDDCECEEDTDLSDYPRFLGDGTLIVVGDNGTSRDVLTAAALTTALVVEGVDTESNILSSFSGSDLDDEDLIVIGGPCENALWERYQGVECDGAFLTDGTALIKLVEKGKRHILYVAGAKAADTQKAADALCKHKSYDFEGMEAELDTSGSAAVLT